MRVLDTKNLRILEILAQNCRTSHTAIAHALNVSKDTVAYRIGQLEQEGFIQQYMVFVDARRLGFTRYHILIQVRANALERAAIIKKLIQQKFVMWINTFIGRYDIQIIVDARDGFHLNQIREELFALCQHHIVDYSILTHLYDLEFTQLNPILDLGTKFDLERESAFGDLITKRRFPVDLNFEPYQASKMELDLLKLLADEPKLNLSELARRLGFDRQTIRKHLVQMISAKLVINFGAIPSLSQLGFVTYYLLVRLSQDTSLSTMQKPFKALRNIFYAGRMIGDHDLILYLNARNPNELNQSIQLFRSEIERYVLGYDLLVQDKVHHWRQFTPGIYSWLTSHLDTFQ